MRALTKSEGQSEAVRVGYFGAYGGQFVPETLMPPLRRLDAAFQEALGDAAFWEELNGYLKDYVGRPTPLYEARRLSNKLGGARIFLKREDLNHTGAHKV
ncbi:MAG: tryptophan synthase subunit beta, partial [bacterium]